MDADDSPSAFWNKRYRATDRLWSPDPNAFLVEFASGRPPGRALDLGAGEARNAIWLAKRGWRVTALDVSEVALARAEQRASEEGVRLDCVVADWREHRLPASSLELVVVSFMHPAPDERGALFDRIADALVPGGHVFVVGIDVADHGRRGPPDPARLYTPERLRRALRAFELLRCDSVAYEQQREDGRRRVVDVVAIARRPGSGAGR